MEDEAGFRREVQAFLDAHFQLKAPTDRVSVLGAGAGEEALEEGRRFLALLADNGWATLPPEQAAIFNRELSRYETPDLYPFGVGTALVAPTIATHGTEDQQRRWLPPLRRGDEIWCQLFSEPDAGSDLAGLTTRASQDGDVWRVSGQKTWSSRAHYARWGLLLARTDPDVPKHAGITAFALDMTAPGVEVRPLKQLNGDDHFNEVFLDDAPVDDADRIGEVNDGWRVALTTLMHERGALGGAGGGLGGGVGRAQLLEHLRAHNATDDPLVRQRAARVISQMDVGRWTAQRAPEGSGAKLRFTKTLKDLANLAADVEGMAAVASEGDQDEWRTLFLTAPSLSIRGGTDEVQRNIVGERVLGLPPEPRPDKGVAFRDVPRTGRP